MLSKTPVVKAIHDAIAGGNFAEAERLLEPYRSQVVAQWNGAESESERQAIAADVNALLEWARVTALTSRAHAQDKLVLLRRDSVYSGSVGRGQAFSLEA